MLSTYRLLFKYFVKSLFEIKKLPKVNHIFFQTIIGKNPGY